MEKDGTEQCRQMSKAALAALQEVGMSSFSFNGCYNPPATGQAGNERLGPIRQWYKPESFRSRLCETRIADSDIIMEVGLLENGYIDKHLVITVGVKIIEVATGRDLGRIRSFQHPRFDMVSLLTGRSLEDFTRLVVDAETDGVRKCLKEIGVERAGISGPREIGSK